MYLLKRIKKIELQRITQKNQRHRNSKEYNISFIIPYSTKPDIQTNHAEYKSSGSRTVEIAKKLKMKSIFTEGMVLLAYTKENFQITNIK